MQWLKLEKGFPVIRTSDVCNLTVIEFQLQNSLLAKVFHYSHCLFALVFT